MSTIFISYRREDSGGHAGRIYDRMVQEFGKDRVFFDIDNIEPGEDFVDVIDRVLARCDVMVVIIGPRWLTCTNSKGTRRIDNPSDYHLLEIIAGLKSSTRIIPVLISDAEMPGETELPDTIKPFARRHAIEIRDNRFGTDTQVLLEAINRVLGKAAAPSVESAPAQPVHKIPPNSQPLHAQPLPDKPAKKKPLLWWITGALFALWFLLFLAGVSSLANFFFFLAIMMLFYIMIRTLYESRKKRS